MWNAETFAMRYQAKYYERTVVSSFDIVLKGEIKRSLDRDYSLYFYFHYNFNGCEYVDKVL